MVLNLRALILQGDESEEEEREEAVAAPGVAASQSRMRGGARSGGGESGAESTDVECVPKARRSRARQDQIRLVYGVARRSGGERCSRARRGRTSACRGGTWARSIGRIRSP